MPIYKFSCKSCSKEFESYMRPYDPVECPHCKAKTVHKLPARIGTYQIKGDNSASTRPKKA